MSNNRRRRPPADRAYRPPQTRMPDEWDDPPRAGRPARRPQDHQRKRPGGQARREVEDLDATIDWRGQTWTIHVDRDNISVDVMEAFEDGKTVTALRALLGDAQWARFKALNPTMVDLNEMFGLMAEELGFTDPGESGASSR